MKSLTSSLEALEARIAPANIVCTVVGHTLKITGDADANFITIDGNADPTIFLVTSSSDTVNGGPGATGFTTPTGITNITVKLLAGEDSLKFSDAVVPIHLKGSLTVNGGDGGNTVEATDLTVDKNIVVTNGDALAGSHQIDIDNLNVGGSVTIRNAAGDTGSSFNRNTAGVSTIRGNLTIINGTGEDSNDIEDLNIGGNVVVQNGHANSTSGEAGYVEIFNFYNTAGRSVIRGNVAVSYLDGNIDYDGIWDYTIKGNASFKYGSANVETHFDGYKVAQPVVIRGSLALKATGPLFLDVGVQYLGTGLIVGKGLTVVSGDGGDNLTFNKLKVGGATKLTYGNGANATQIDDSTFGGAFKLTGGSNVDTINIETTTGTTLPTIFKNAATFFAGAGADVANFADVIDDGQFIYAYNKIVFHNGTGLTTSNAAANHVIFPFGGEIQFVP